MAPLRFTLTTATTSISPFHSQTGTNQRRLQTHAKQTRRFQVSCNVSSDDNENPLSTNPQPQKLILPDTSLDLRNVDRRNLLLGLGGLYSTVNLSGLPPAFAIPIASPPIVPPSLKPRCKDAGSGFRPEKGLLRSTACCPPTSKRGPERPYLLPRGGPTRIRMPIHSSSKDLKRYREALEIMRSLPDDDPRSFTNQAKIHCAYCNGSYMQSGQELQIHNSWLFFPFHRWYLYFFERILGHLIKDPTFALPYWNWDNPEGMNIAGRFEKATRSNSKPNALYDIYRNANHLNSAKVDLDYQGVDRGVTDDFQQEINYTTINRQMLRNSFDTTSFFGGRYVAGNEPIANADNVVGAIEAGCHTAIHRWVGDPNSPNGEDMGNFYSAGYDPLFYVHHANVDRMWTLWNKMGGEEPKDRDWREASYVFYDENKFPVRVRNKDAVNLGDLNYRYAKSDIPWTARPPRSRCRRPGFEPRKNTKSFTEKKDVKFPLSLPTTVRIRIPRPPACINRNPRQKMIEKEILCFIGINFDSTETVKFDVFVNDCDDEEITPCDSENVGSFSAIPHAKGMSMSCKSGMRFALTELLEETGAEGKSSVRVTIVPRTPGSNVSIDDIQIRLIPALQRKSL